MICCIRTTVCACAGWPACVCQCICMCLEFLNNNVWFVCARVCVVPVSAGKKDEGAFKMVK